MWNRHRESKNTKLYEIGSSTKLLFTFLSLKVLRHEERETQSFYADCFYIVSSQPNQRTEPVAHKVVWPCPALNLNFLVRWQKFNWLLFLKSQPTLPVRDVTLIPWFQFLFSHLWLTHPLCTRVNTCCMLHLTNPCTKWKVLILTKPKGKICKRKSLRHYITHTRTHTHAHTYIYIYIWGCMGVWVWLSLCVFYSTLHQFQKGLKIRM